MSELQKKISRVGRRDGPRLGFGAARGEQPRALLLAVIADSQQAAQEGFAGGADVVIVAADDPAQAAAMVEAVKAGGVTGAKLPSLSEAGADQLRKAGCDFVISPLETTASAAVDPERMGQVVVATPTMDDTTLRALGPMNLDALFVERQAGPMMLAQQLELVRLSSFTSSPLLVTINTDATVGELRVLRDSGVAGVIPPRGTSAEGLAALSETLKSVPPPRRGRREGGDIVLVPTVARHDEQEEEEEGDE